MKEEGKESEELKKRNSLNGNWTRIVFLFFVDPQWNIECTDDALFPCRANRPRSNDAYDPDGLVIRTGPKRLAKSGLFSIVHLSVHVESASRIHLDEQMVSSHDPSPYLSGLAQQCLINRFLPPDFIITLCDLPPNFKTFVRQSIFSSNHFWSLISRRRFTNYHPKYRTIIFTFLLISRPTFSLFIFYPRPNISNNTHPTIVYNIYIFVSHLFLSPLEFFIFRRIPVSKETFNSIDTTVGRIGKFPRANGACANDRWSFVPFTGRLPVCYVVAAV